jgi:hypothetical protein
MDIEHFLDPQTSPEVSLAAVFEDKPNHLKKVSLLLRENLGVTVHRLCLFCCALREAFQLPGSFPVVLDF